jgi:hypothetical protein
MLATRHNALGKDLHRFFLQTFRRLGASVGVNYLCRDACSGGIREVQTMFVSCPREAWVAEFGELEQVHRHFDSTSGKWLRSWEHQSIEGPVQCVGQFFERSPGSNWIIVKQVSVSRSRREYTGRGLS